MARRPRRHSPRPSTQTPARRATTSAVSDWLRRYYLRSFIERYESWLDASAAWPLAWRDVAGASDVVMRLTPDRLAALQAEFEALCARFREDEVPAVDPAGQVIQLSLYAFPFEAQPS